MGQVSDMLQDNNRDLLPTFHFLEKEDLKDMKDFLQVVNVYKGETICEEGNICDYLAFIVSGKVEIRKNTEFEGKEVVMGILSRGAMVGEIWVLGDHPGPVTAVAKEDSKLVMISRKNFNILIETHPKTGVKLLKGMLLTNTLRLKNAYDRIASLF